MKLDAEHLYEVVGMAHEFWQQTHRVPTPLHKKAEQNGQNERRDLVARQRRSEQADGDKCARQKEQSEIRTENAAAVEVAFWLAELMDADVINDGRKQRKQHQNKASEEFSAHDGAVGERFGGEEFDGSAVVFFGKRAHRDGWNEEEKNERRVAKKRVERGKTVVDNALIWQGPHDDSS